MKQKYQLSKTAWKAVKYCIIFAVPALINHFAQLYPDLYSLPIGAGIVAGWDYVKRNYIIKEN